MWLLGINNRSRYTLKVSTERRFTRAGNTIFVPPPSCCFSRIISMNILENQRFSIDIMDFILALWVAIEP